MLVQHNSTLAPSLPLSKTCQREDFGEDLRSPELLTESDFLQTIAFRATLKSLALDFRLFCHHSHLSNRHYSSDSDSFCRHFCLLQSNFTSLLRVPVHEIKFAKISNHSRWVHKLSKVGKQEEWLTFIVFVKSEIAALRLASSSIWFLLSESFGLWSPLFF